MEGNMFCLCLAAFFVTTTVAVPASRLHLPTYTDRKTFPMDITFNKIHHASAQPTTDTPYVEHSTKYRSQAMPLADGEVVFTDPQTTFLQFPKGKIAITGFWAEVVDVNNNPVTLEEAYLHHWLVFGPPNAGVCGGYLAYNFGVGEESRGSPVHFPSPYALVVDDDTEWGANIHILRTVNLDPTYGTKGCIECLYAPTKGCAPEDTGTFKCCGDGSFCPTLNSSRVRGVHGAASAKDYYLSYTVYWRELDSTVKPITTYVLDASNCQIEYNIYQTPTNLSTTEWSMQMPTDFGIVFGAGHQHIGANNITLYHGNDNTRPICTSVAVYGTEEGVPGNEKGYVVKIPPCTFQDPYPVKKGDTIRLVSLYDVSPQNHRTWDQGPMHGGVMSLFFLSGVPM